MSNNKNFVVSEGIAASGVNLVQGDAPVTESTTVGFAPTSNWSYDSVVLDLLGTANVYDFFMSPDGTKIFKMFSYTSGSNYVMALNGYNLTTAWDLSTMTSVPASTCDLLSSSINYSTYYNAFFISPDGTRLYYSSNNISQQATYYWTLSTPWDLGTKGSLSAFYPTSQDNLGTGSTAISPTTIQFSTDGSRYFIFSYNAIQQFTCTTPWDLNTVTVLDNSNFNNRQYTWDTRNQKRIEWYLFDSTFGSNAAMLSCTFNNTGTALYITTSSGSLNSRHSVYKVDLENPWDITSINRLSYSKFLYENQITNDVHAIRFKSDGTKMYLLDGANQNVYQYSTSTTENVTKFDLSTGVFFKHSPTADARYKFINPQDDTYIETVQLEVTNVGQGTAYDIENGSYESKSMVNANQTTQAADVKLSSDGSKVFVMSNNTDTIYQYNLSTNYDVSSATVTGSTVKSFSVGSQATFPRGFEFNPDGTKLYVVDPGTDTVYQYALTEGFNIETASYDSKQKSVTTEDGVPTAIALNDDGTKMYIVGNQYDAVFQYSLGTPYDVSSATYDSVSLDVSSEETQAYGAAFNSDGTKFFISGDGSQSVHQYGLTTPYDLNTATYDSVSLDVSSEDTDIRGMSFNSDGTKLYVVGIVNDRVFQYSTGEAPSAATITWDDSILWSSYSAPTMPGVNETDTFTFQTKNGGVSYVGLASGDDHS